jgi:hypothetical protein
MILQVGDRIRVSENYHWAKGALGIISDPPDFAKQLADNDSVWHGIRHLVKGSHGVIEFVWVWFDEPQIDSDGDGPYKGAEIPIDAIIRSD